MTTALANETTEKLFERAYEISRILFDRFESDWGQEEESMVAEREAIHEELRRRPLELAERNRMHVAQQIEDEKNLSNELED